MGWAVAVNGTPLMVQLVDEDGQIITDGDGQAIVGRVVMAARLGYFDRPLAGSLNFEEVDGDES
jgi:hypothetical protein